MQIILGPQYNVGVVYSYSLLFLLVMSLHADLCTCTAISLTAGSLEVTS